MTGTLCLQNQQRTCPVDLRLLRCVARLVVEEALGQHSYQLGLRLVKASVMTRLNEQFLQHAGPTDVITFNYAPPGRPRVLQGDIIICPEVARQQARRFHTHWSAELVRYLIHGLLHLQGYDDLKSAARLQMKRAEDRLLRRVTAQFPLRHLARKHR